MSCNWSFLIKSRLRAMTLHSSPSHSPSASSIIRAALRSPTPDITCTTPASPIVKQGSLKLPDDLSPKWAVPPECLNSLPSPCSDVSLGTFYKQIMEAYAHNMHVIDEYEHVHPRPEPPSECLLSIPDPTSHPDVRERWYREFGTSPDVGSNSQEATVGGTDVLGPIGYLLVYPAICFRRDDQEIEAILEDRIQKKRTQQWIGKLRSRETHRDEFLLVD
ncbi:hypothetical protein C8R43DRAFT_1130305 [Mycena crocata]|nr:hypothetical protein C8R43DRAFT_1130305 [Mycena crocata]